MSRFTRTTCACKACTACCKRQPGPLAPGDFERIQAHLQASDEEMQKLFWASPGAVGRLHSGKTVRVGTITPRFHKGRCVFLDENDRCKIHSVAPFGCAYFDTHMDNSTAQERSNWLAYEQLTNEEYQQLRKTLPYATHHKALKYTL
jgi:Fe-S-cluster containining protein